MITFVCLLYMLGAHTISNTSDRKQQEYPFRGKLIFY